MNNINFNDKLILLVEDDDITKTSIQLILENFGYKVISTVNGEKAIEIVSLNSEIDLILMDIELGKGIDGGETAKKILQNHDLPIIFLSSHTRQDIIIKIDNISSYGYIHKDSGKDVLNASIKMAFRLFELKTIDKKNKIEIHEAKQRFKNIIENAPFGYYRVGKDYKWEYVNKEWEKMHALTKKEVIGKDCLFTQPADYKKQAKKNIKAVFSGKTIVGEFARKVKGSDKVKYHTFNIQPVYEKNKIVAIEGFINDITERKDFENEIIKLISEKDKQLAETLMYKTVFNSINEGVITLDTESRITSLNPSAEKILMIKKEEAIGKRCYDVIKSEICEENCLFQNAVNTNECINNYPVMKELVNGKKIFLSVSSTNIKNKTGVITGSVRTFKDITEIYNLREELQTKYKFENIVGNSQKMQDIYSLIENVSSTDVTVLILGETGTGKELVAKAIHYNGIRKDKSFVSVNCSALSEGLLESELFGHVKGSFTGAVSDRIGRFELADEGTLFLDEIGDINYNIQTKILRAIELKEFEKVGSSIPLKTSARIIVATNKDLYYEMKMNRFRSDLYYRLNTVTIYLPPLRERKEDLYDLIKHFMNLYKNKYNMPNKNISSETLSILYDYNWPGNVRQLDNCLEAAFIHSNSDTILPVHLPKEIYNHGFYSSSNGFTNKRNKENFNEKETIVNTLNKTKWNKKKTANLLNISRTTLYYKLKKYNISL